MMICKPNFQKAQSAAEEILVSADWINSFPIKTKKLIREFSDISFCTYNEAKIKGVDMECFGSNDALLFESNGRYIIFYNEKVASKARLRFSLIHEFGHYYLEHKLDNDISKELYDKQEIEANFFAAELLMPSCLIRELSHRGININRQYLIENFGVSNEAAGKRIEYLNKTSLINFNDDSQNLHDLILCKFSDFLCYTSGWQNSFDYDYDDEEFMQHERDQWR